MYDVLTQSMSVVRSWFLAGAGNATQTGEENTGVGCYAMEHCSTGNYNTVVQLTLATPTTSGDTCTAGTFWADASYLYVCTATNTIKRAALSAF